MAHMVDFTTCSEITALAFPILPKAGPRKDAGISQGTPSSHPSQGTPREGSCFPAALELVSSSRGL